MNFTIRNATPADAAVIARYNSQIAEETEDGPLDSEVIGPGVEKILSDPSLGRYWVAESEGKIIGQLMVTYEWSDWRDGMMWWIQSVYVAERYRRSGVLAALYRHIELLAREENEVAGIRLYVEKNNLRAQRIYDNLGMDMTDYRIMQVEFDRKGFRKNAA